MGWIKNGEVLRKSPFTVGRVQSHKQKSVTSDIAIQVHCSNPSMQEVGRYSRTGSSMEYLITCRQSILLSNPAAAKLLTVMILPTATNDRSDVMGHTRCHPAHKPYRVMTAVVAQ